MGSKKDSIELKNVNGGGAVRLPFPQALKIMLWQEEKGLKDWEVSEPNYKFKDGEIYRSGSTGDTKKSKK